MWRILILFTLIGVVLTGCMNGMYSSKLSIDKCENGVCEYREVNALDEFEELSTSMPVVVELGSEKKNKNKPEISAALWFFSLGVIPAFESSEITRDVTVRTPLGVQHGDYTIEAKLWLGWLPIFVPYPGWADQRVYGTDVKLPNATIENEVRNRLVRNLVSQFSKEEYAIYISPEQREKRKKEKILREEYASWEQSDDYVADVTMQVFDEKYRNGWRERAEKKRVLREEYASWKQSDDYVADVTMQVFDEKYRNGWRERAEKKRVLREEYASWKQSDDYVADVTMQVFDEKYRNGWRERAEKKREIRLAKEAEERAEEKRFAMRTDLYNTTVDKTLQQIKICYQKGRGYKNPFGGNEWKSAENKDWLSKWALPRLNLSEADALAGQALLSEFGTKYLPNAYANYEKKRDALIELQQIFNEQFSQPWTIKSTNPKWSAFNKVLERFVKARTEFFICHDELCHYWLLHRFGVLTEREFSEIDSKPLVVHLLPENVELAGYALLNGNKIESKISDFALKYAPESNMAYQKLSREFNEHNTLLADVVKQHIQMDDVRHSRVFAAAVFKRNDLVREMNALATQFEVWYTNHQVGEMTAEGVAKADAEMAKQMKPFIDLLPNYIKDWSLGPIIPDSELVTIPGRSYMMQRTEVTQLQWMAVMGNNPSGNKGPDLPVENVSWGDCQKFIERASEMDGYQYRLPTESEWEYACRAGSNTDWGMRVNGECGPLEVMGWFSENSDGKTHPVAFKEPNAWGLFDMHGNVWEWRQDKEDSSSDIIIRGGCYRSIASECSASFSHSLGSLCRFRSDDVGFRLAISQE